MDEARDFADSVAQLERGSVSRSIVLPSIALGLANTASVPTLLRVTDPRSEHWMVSRRQTSFDAHCHTNVTKKIFASFEAKRHCPVL